MSGRCVRTAAVTLLAAGVIAACGDGDEPVARETETEAVIVDDDETTTVTEVETDDTFVRIVEPEDGAVVNSPFTVRFQAEGIEIEPAGEAREGAGHFHLVLDQGGCVPAGEVIPADDDHLHFGEAQMETLLELGPGQHEICLQVGDGEHVATDDTHVINVLVEE